jgi:hypothetical protein
VTVLSPAERLLKSLGVAKPSDIDVEAIAYATGAKVKVRALDGCEARIVGAGDRAVITVNERSGWARRRFSIGHELGHWRHHRGKAFNCRPEDIGSARGYDPHDPERVADRFAADLLLPGFLFCPLADRLGRMTLDSADELAKVFDVSLTAAAIRLVETGPAPAMLICHRKGRGPWFRPHPDLPEMFFPHRELDPDSYAIDVWEGKMDRTRVVKVGADAWIDRRNADRFEVMEQTFRIGHDRILTMVWWQDEGQIEDALRQGDGGSPQFRRR